MPVIVFAAACVGSAALAHYLKAEWRRVNDELDAAEREAQHSVGAASLPTLRQDPASGEWRL
jgi:hypothetical protein